jgi:atlastin
MDTQGTFDHSSTVQDCATIFALSTLLSSVQIFNVSAQIQEDDLNNLRLFTEYAQLACDNENREAFQRLVFLVRDWPHSEENAYGFEGGHEYLNDILKTGPRQKKELQELWQNIRRSFEKLDAFLIPHPGKSIAENNSQMVLGSKQFL